MADDDNQTEIAAKSGGIVDPKYRQRYDKPIDWLAEQLKAQATATKMVKKSFTEGEGDDAKKVTREVEVEAGVDVDKLFTIAEINTIDVAKYELQRETHGFPGRFRMTLGNMLRAAARKRHGLFLLDEGGEDVWTEAPADWLTAQGASAEPTHTRDGQKIAKPKPPKEEPVAEAAE